MKLRVICAPIKDDADYDMFVDSGIQNTLKKFWSWANEAGVEISFTKDYSDEMDHRFNDGLKVIVDANFKNKEDFAIFKLAHEGDDLPYDRMRIDSNAEGHFIKS